MNGSTFPARLASARESAGMSLQGLADASGTSHSSVRLWLAGRAEPSIGNSAKLAEALGVTPCWLAYGCEKCSPVSGAPLQDTAASSR
jgi:transcriptional regulator with XRE-family HTH domain